MDSDEGAFSTFFIFTVFQDLKILLLLDMIEDTCCAMVFELKVVFMDTHGNQLIRPSLVNFKSDLSQPNIVHTLPEISHVTSI